MAKPKPKPTHVVCTECGLPWGDHTKDRKTEPTADVCIRLLKAELAKRPKMAIYGFNGSSATTTAIPLYANLQ